MPRSREHMTETVPTVQCTHEFTRAPHDLYTYSHEHMTIAVPT
jgi:hypothetical protein